jgi:hypothetical protein
MIYLSVCGAQEQTSRDASARFDSGDKKEIKKTLNLVMHVATNARKLVIVLNQYVLVRV